MGRNMTRDEVLALPAGPELDVLVAERVMGARLHPVKTSGPDMTYEQVPLRDGCVQDRPLSPYSTDMTAAWMALEHVAGRKHWSYRIESEDGCGSGPLAYVTIQHGRQEWEAHSGFGDNEDSVPLAICRAALLAVEASAP